MKTLLGRGVLILVQEIQIDAVQPGQACRVRARPGSVESVYASVEDDCPGQS